MNNNTYSNTESARAAMANFSKRLATRPTTVLTKCAADTLMEERATREGGVE